MEPFSVLGVVNLGMGTGNALTQPLSGLKVNTLVIGVRVKARARVKVVVTAGPWAKWGAGAKMRPSLNQGPLPRPQARRFL